MSDSENVCVGCKHPIVDESIEGDITLERDSFHIDPKDLAVGVDSGCRNCAVILDAIVTFVGRGDQSSMQSGIRVYSFPLSQELHIGDNLEIIRHNDLPRNSKPFKSGVWNIKEGRPLAGNTSSQETMRRIQEWKTNCVQLHEHCMQRLAVSLPKRILFITAEHVFLREQPGSLAPYACLSHCWGLNGPAVKLTAETAGRLRDGLKSSDLPKTFRDAVEVCHHLGIYYIWIDALCIFQDSDEDWKEAAATMGDIYENSHITIAATASQDSNGGLFSLDRPVTRRLEKHPHLYVRTSLDMFLTSKSMPLLDRAWVYQERRLSQRTIHFCKQQVYWECQTGFASEDSREDRIWKIYGTEIDDASKLGWGDKCVDHKMNWQKTVVEYTVLQLTYERDRLPAIAAVVDRMSRLKGPDDVYIAGLWKNSILSDLLWSTLDYGRLPARISPSWSWASSARNSGITWNTYEFTKEVKVVGLKYTIVGAANLGKVRNASIILMVPVLDLTSFDELDPRLADRQTRFEGISKSAPITEQFRSHNLRISVTWFYPDYDLSTTRSRCKHVHTVKLLLARDSCADIGGIVVWQTFENAPEYKRIGFLDVELITTKSAIDRKKTYKEKVEEKEEDVARLMQSLPMEEVKII